MHSLCAVRSCAESWSRPRTPALRLPGSRFWAEGSGASGPCGATSSQSRSDSLVWLGTLRGDLRAGPVSAPGPAATCVLLRWSQTVGAARSCWERYGPADAGGGTLPGSPGLACLTHPALQHPPCLTARVCLGCSSKPWVCCRQHVGDDPPPGCGRRECPGQPVEASILRSPCNEAVHLLEVRADGSLHEASI